MTDWLLGKSATQWVNEICVKQLTQAKWDSREATPGQQPPTFMSSCTILYADKTLRAEGTGKTKKSAQQEAALEMLNILGMTPATLMQLNSVKSKSSSNNGSCNQLGSSSVGEGVLGNDGDVTDTDDVEAHSHSNPIGELLAICDQLEFQNPQYEDVLMEGPPHRRIFTVSCAIKEMNIVFRGRRHTKKFCKKIAAYRALREINARGCTYIRHTESGRKDGAESSTDSGNSSTAACSIDLSDIILGLDDAVNCAISNQGHTCDDIRILKGRRTYCTDDSQECLQFCKDYPHAFAHLKKCEALDKILKTDNIDTFSEGPLVLLQEISREIGIQVKMVNVKANVHPNHPQIKLLELNFPFDFKYPVPKKAVVYGRGLTDQEARVNAYKDALQFLRSQFIFEYELGD